MSLDETLDMFECMKNLDDSKLLSYLCKNVGRIRDAAEVGRDTITELKRINKLLDKWEVME